MAGASHYDGIKKQVSKNDQLEEDKKTVKVVVVGDGAVGKTCLCTVYTQKTFPTSYNPTVFDTYPTDMVLADPEKTAVKVNIWDTAGQEEFENLRTLTYPDTDLFIVCFSMVDRNSFENVGHVVGTKKDLIGNKDHSGRQTSDINKKSLPTQSEIDKLVKSEKLIGFKAVSAKEDIESVSEAFELATLRAVTNYQPQGIPTHLAEANALVV